MLTNNLKLVARRLVWAKLLNGGQTCISADYVIAKSSIKNELIEVLKAEITRRYGVNPKTSEDFPRIINSKNLKRLESLIGGKSILHGGEIDETENYIAPTLIDNPSLDSAIMQEEIFGPILPVITFKTLEEKAGGQN